MILSRAQFSQIVAFVLCLHAALLSLILFEHAPTPKKVVTKPLVVQTVKLAPKNNPAASPGPARLAAAEQPKPKPQAEKSASLPPAPKVAAAKPKPAAKPVAAKPKTTDAPEKTVASAPVPNKALLAQAAESFAKMQAVKTPRKNEGANTEAVPVTSFKLAVEGVGTPAIVEADGYEQELAGRLQLQLRLPEYGPVEIKLTLKRDGSFVKVKIEKAESVKNRAYVEKRISEVVFPPYNNRFKDDPHTFAITLCNE